MYEECLLYKLFNNRFGYYEKSQKSSNTTALGRQ